MTFKRALTLNMQPILYSHMLKILYVVNLVNNTTSQSLSYGRLIVNVEQCCTACKTISRYRESSYVP